MPFLTGATGFTGVGGEILWSMISVDSEWAVRVRACELTNAGLTKLETSVCWQCYCLTSQFPENQNRVRAGISGAIHFLNINCSNRESLQLYSHQFLFMCLIFNIERLAKYLQSLCIYRNPASAWISPRRNLKVGGKCGVEFPLFYKNFVAISVSSLT